MSRHFLDATDLSPEAKAAVEQVFERVCCTLQLEPADPMRDAVAKAVVSAASSGGLDLDELYRESLAQSLNENWLR